MRKNFFHLRLKSLLAFSFLILLDSCATNPVTGKKEIMLMSENQEVALGVQSDPSIVASFGAYPDPALQAFISEKGAQMAKVSHRAHLDFNFKLLDSPVVNAFALPGGYVYFTRGIMAHFNNEAEFAGVLGHEIGHVTARHGASQYSKQMLAQLGFVAGVIASPTFAQFAGYAQQGLGLLFLKFGRDDESQSDLLGAEYSTRIGYDAHYMADFFGTLSRLSSQGGGSEIPTFMSTHPDPDDREVKVHQHARDWQNQLKTTNLQVNRNQYLRMIDGLVYGEDPRQGYVENDYFYHPELKFQFPVPKSWRTVNTPQAVQMAPEDSKALIMFTLGQGNNPDEAAKAMLEQYQLSLVEQSDTKVNGMTAKVVVADQKNEETGQTIRILSYLIKYNDLIFTFLGVADINDHNRYKSYFLNTMKGFNKLTDASKINRKPERIIIKKVEKGATLQSTLKSFNMPSDRLEELAILNGMELSDTVNRGMLIKTIGK